ncbi:MAG: tetratricopeptide repeat protein [Acidobacteriota bacterium]
MKRTRPAPASAVPSARAFAGPALAIFAVAMALRLTHVLLIRHALVFNVLSGDARGYDAWASRIAAGDWMGQEVFYQAPLYPYVLGALYTLFGRDLLVARVAQAAIGSLAAAALGYAGWRLHSRAVGLAAGLGLAVYAPAIFFDGILQKSTLDVFLTAIALALVADIVARGGTTRRWALLGLALGALSLTRENALLLVAVVAAWAAAPRGRLSRQGLSSTAALLAGVAVAVGPVALRNFAVGGGLYLTTSQFGSNLYIGNNPSSDGTYVALREGRGAPEFERTDATELAEAALGRRLTPGEVSAYWTRRALAYVRAEPLDWMALMARKAALLVNAEEMLDTESQEAYAEVSWLLAWLGRVTHFGILFPLAVVGAWVAWPRRADLWILYALTAAYALSVVVFFVFARYRFPLVPFLMLFAAVGAVALANGRRSSEARRALRGAATAGLVALVASNWPMLSPDLMRAISAHNLATALQEDGRHREALAGFERALAIRPDYGPAYNNLGTVRMALGDALGARAAFREAVRLQPNSSHARTNLANACYDLGVDALERGALHEAEALFREALDVSPHHARAWNNLGIALATQGRLDDAIAAFRQALAADPGLADAQRNLEKALGK